MNTTKHSWSNRRVKVLKVSSSVPIFRVGMEPVAEILDKFHTLTRLSAREDGVLFCRRESFKTYKSVMVLDGGVAGHQSSLIIEKI